MLTVGLPTYNRAERLAEQLEWLSRARKGYEDVCEVVVSDNASTDETDEVVQRWAARADGDRNIRVLRNASNLGAVANVAQCISVARGAYVWVVGDDDDIAESTLAFVIDAVRADPDLALLILNYSMRDADDGRLLFERCFDLAGPYRSDDGAALFERCLSVPRTVRWGGLGFTTALVYRTLLARDALSRWPAGLDNLGFQVYITAVCAFGGPAALTPQTRLECVAGGHHFSRDTKVLLAFWSAHMAEMLVKLAELGCDPRLCLRRILERPKSFLPLVGEGLRRWPGHTGRMLVRYLVAAGRGVTLAAPRLGRRPRRRPPT